MRLALVRWALILGVVSLFSEPLFADDAHITVAAAADLRGALDQVVTQYQIAHPDSKIDVIYGSSGNLTTQIEQGAPFELFFSADSSFPERLVEHGKASGKPVQYAEGHIVLWSASIDMKGVQVKDLSQTRFGHIAIANPLHAPYGKRAEQALRASGIWDDVQSRLVIGENIAQTAQYVQTGNAQVGFVAESFAMNPAIKGSYIAVPASLYEPLRQSLVLTQRGGNSELAKSFMSYVQSPEARALLAKYGFALPAAAAP
ncbi:molybdate ABC transporter substrate-binding protein [Dyella sp. 20L07]|uniref:molybdate ABC transporter substrate-binding protein n=1 Tax=Dyella sp. 20L07 TaxID=3384240 RepID=UPI003D2B7A3C